VLDPLWAASHRRGGRVGALPRLDLGVWSARGAVPVFRLVRFPEPPAEPDVHVPAHPALHGHAGGVIR
jgi:hypothetical protein